MFLTLATMLSALSVSGHGIYGNNLGVNFSKHDDSVIVGNFYANDYLYIQWGSSSNDYLSIDFTDSDSGNVYSLFKIYTLDLEQLDTPEQIEVHKQNLPFDLNYDFTCNLSWRAVYANTFNFRYYSETSKVMTLAKGNYTTIYEFSVDTDTYDSTQILDDTFYNLCFSFSYINEFEFESRVTGAVNGNAYNSGYTDGYNNGYTHGVDDANVEAFDDGYDRGYAQGVADTEAEGVASYTFMNLVASLADTPIVMLHGMFDFQIFGVNVLTVILSMVTALILLFVVKKLIK